MLIVLIAVAVLTAAAGLTYLITRTGGLSVDEEKNEVYQAPPKPDAKHRRVVS